MASDLFWLKDPKILFNKDRLTEFFINCNMSDDEKLNAILRLGIYTSLVLTLYYNNPKMLGLTIIFIVFTIFVHKFNSKEPFHEMEKMEVTGESKKEFTSVTEPTLLNPFMNPSQFDDPDKPEAQEYYTRTDESLKIKDKIKSAFDFNLYQDVGDTYSSANSFREFYTVPEISPKQDFKEYLFGQIHSAKENTYNGFKNLYEPTQAKRHIN
jgi:hypothetical protein